VIELFGPPKETPVEVPNFGALFFFPPPPPPKEIFLVFISVRG